MPRFVRPLLFAVASVLVAVSVRAQVGPVGLQMESQNWWKTTVAGTGVLTVARAQEYQHVHFRTQLPAHKVYPAGTPFTPQATLILHHAPGQIIDLEGPMPNPRDSTDFPIPPATGTENELLTVRTYPDRTTPAGGVGWTNTLTFETPPANAETRRTRIYTQIGREGNLRIASWMADVAIDRGYINVMLPSATAKAAATGPISGTWQFRFIAWGASGAPTFNGSVLLDPNFHAASNQLGTIVWQDPNVGSSSSFQHIVNVDTTQLTNGVHRIAVIVDDEGHSPFPGAMASVLQVWFTVQN